MKTPSEAVQDAVQEAEYAGNSARRALALAVFLVIVDVALMYATYDVNSQFGWALGGSVLITTLALRELVQSKKHETSAAANAAREAQNIW